MSDHYSIIQFFPRSSRREGINVGVVLLAARAGVVRVRMSSSNELVRRHSSDAPLDLEWLTRAKRSMQRRIEAIPPTEAGLLEQIARVTGQFAILPPQPVAEGDVERTLQDLFEAFVGEVDATRRPRESAS